MEPSFLFTPKIQAQRLEALYIRHPRCKGRSFVKKTGMPEGSERKRTTFLESFGIIETPRRVYINTKAFEANHKGFGRDELFQRIFLHKSQSWAILRRIKRKRVREDGKR